MYKIIQLINTGPASLLKGPSKDDIGGGGDGDAPTQNETLNQCLADVDPPSTTSAQHQPNICLIVYCSLFV